jgi:hypothetical protein
MLMKKWLLLKNENGAPNYMKTPENVFKCVMGYFTLKLLKGLLPLII